jgi:DNA polymerase elongation subunit (family B)
VICTIQNFHPFCFIELPRFYRRQFAGRFGPPVPWDHALAAGLSEAISAVTKIKFVKSTLVMKSKFFYHQPQRNSFPHLQVAVNSFQDLKTLANTINYASAIPTPPQPPQQPPPPPGVFTWPPQQQRFRQQRTIRGLDYGERFGNMVLRVWEHDIPLSRKLLTVTNMTFSGAFQIVPTGIIPETDPNREFSCRELILQANPDNVESDEWWRHHLHPVSTEFLEQHQIAAVGTPTLFSYDIETYTNRHEALPDATNDDHCISMISCCTLTPSPPSGGTASPPTRNRFLITTIRESVSKDAVARAYIQAGHSPDAIPDCEIIQCETEADMLDAFVNLIDTVDPDVLIGYNTHAYDNPYLDMRYRKQINVEGKWPPKLGVSRLEPVKLVESKWKSGAYGVVENHVFSTEGRISIDVMATIKRDYKLTKYSLKEVAKHFLGGDSGAVGKHDVSAKEMFIAHENAFRTFEEVAAGTLQADSPVRLEAIEKSSTVAAYAIQDSEVTLDLFGKLNLWIGISQMSAVAGVPMVDTFSRGQQCRITSLLYDMASRDDIILDKRRLMVSSYRGRDGDAKKDDTGDDPSLIRYKGGFVGETIRGLHENVLGLDFSSLYPSIIMALNISPDTLLIESTPLENRAFSCAVGRFDTSQREQVLAADVNKTTDPRYGCCGGSQPPPPHEAILCPKDDNDSADVAPAAAVPAVIEKKRKRLPAIKDDNGDFCGDDDDDDGDDDGGGDNDISPITTTTSASAANPPPVVVVGAPALAPTSSYQFKFVKSSVRRGLLPRLVERLVAERREVRKEMDGLQDKLKLCILNQRQNALKVTANSAYGFLGAQRNGAFSLVEAAMSITSAGRQYITKVYEHIVNKYNGRIIGGDTDSCFFQLPDQIKHPADCHKWGEELARDVSTLFPPPLKMEFEKAMRMIAFRKKMYAALQINKDGTFVSKILTRGIVLARRDKCRFLTNLYQQLLDHVLHKRGIVGAIELIKNALCAAFGGTVTPDQFEIVKALGSNYKQPSFQMNVFAELCAQSGRPARPGDRLGFVIVTQPAVLAPSTTMPQAVLSTLKTNNLGLRMRLTDVWAAAAAATAGTTTEQPPPPPIDALYYIQNLCVNPIDQLFGTAYKTQLAESGILDEFCFRPRSNVVYKCTEPVKMICNIIRHTQTILAKRRAKALSLLAGAVTTKKRRLNATAAAVAAQEEALLCAEFHAGELNGLTNERMAAIVDEVMTDFCNRVMATAGP